MRHRQPQQYPTSATSSQKLRSLKPLRPSCSAKKPNLKMRRPPTLKMQTPRSEQRGVARATQKVLAQRVLQAGMAEEMIRAGRVAINFGQVAVLGDKVADSDHIELDGIPVLRDPNLVHYLLPSCVTSYPQLATQRIGKLSSTWFLLQLGFTRWGDFDADSEGLIILTNDGDLTHRLTHPSLVCQKNIWSMLKASCNAQH